MDSYVGFRNLNEHENDVMNYVVSCFNEDGFMVSQGIDQLIIETDDVRLSVGALVAGHKRRAVTVSNKDGIGSFSQFSLSGTADKEKIVSELKMIMLQSGGKIPIKNAPKKQEQQVLQETTATTQEQPETAKDSEINVYAEPIADDSTKKFNRTVKIVSGKPEEYKDINAAVCELLETAEHENVKLEITIRQITE